MHFEKWRLGGAAAGIRAVCGLADKEEIKSLFESSGYIDIDGRTLIFPHVSSVVAGKKS